MSGYSYIRVSPTVRIFFPRPNFDLPGPFTFIFFPNSAVLFVCLFVCFVLFCFSDAVSRLANILPNIPGIEHTTTERILFHLLPFNRSLTVVLSLRKRGLPEREKRIFFWYCRIKLAFLSTVYVFGSCSFLC